MPTPPRCSGWKRTTRTPVQRRSARRSRVRRWRAGSGTGRSPTATPPRSSPRPPISRGSCRSWSRTTSPGVTPAADTPGVAQDPLRRTARGSPSSPEGSGSALRWWSSTVTGLLLKPFPFLRPEDSDRRGGRGRRGDVDAHAAYPGVTHHPGNAYSEGDGPDRQGLGLQPLPGVGYQHSPGSEQQPGQQQSFASPAPATGDPFPLPGSHEVPQNNATYEPTQEVPAGAAQRAVRYRRLPVYLSGDDH